MQTFLQHLYSASSAGVSAAFTTGSVLTPPDHVAETTAETLWTAVPPGVGPSAGLSPSGESYNYNYYSYHYPRGTPTMSSGAATSTGGGVTAGPGVPLGRLLVSLTTTGGRHPEDADDGGDPTGAGPWWNGGVGTGTGTGSTVEESGRTLVTTLLEGLSSSRRTNSGGSDDYDDPSSSSSSGPHSLWLLSLVCFLAAICAAIVVIWFVRRRGPYRRLAVMKEKGPDYRYIYKPHGVLDEEYENTFVGVSVPLLQDITVI